MSKVFKAVGKAVTSVVKGVTKAVTSVVKAVVNVAASVINFIAQPFMGLLGGMPSVPDAAQEAERQQGVLFQTQGSDVRIPVVYGYRKVGGAVTFVETGSNNNRYLYVAYVFSEGLVEGLREVFIDDWQLPVNLTANLNAGQVVDVNADRYKGRVRLQWYPGQYYSNPRNSPVGKSVKSGIFSEAPSFKDTMVYNGLSVLFARYEWKEIKTQDDADNNPFSGNVPNVQVSLLGKRVASLLVNTEETTYEAAPVRYSTNPAEILLDYMRNPRYGKGVDNNDIDWLSWKRAARKCNQTVTYLKTDSQIQGPILTANHVMDTSQSIFANVKTLLMGFRAYMPYVQGKYKLKIEDAGNETDILSGSAVIFQTITKDDIIGNVTYTGIEKSAKYNVVAVNYVDPDQKWSVQQVIFPETQEERQQFINTDGGRENKLEATFPTITNYAIAKDMARLLFNKSRRQETCSMRVTSKAIELEPGDNIRIQSNILNFGTDPWRVISININDDMSVDLNCVRNPDDIYPHVRVGEEDIVLPTFIPRGSIVFFPGSNNAQLIGLIPPTNAIYPSDFISDTSNPGPTDPDGVLGGGVGGGNPPSGSGPEDLPPANQTPVPPDNNPAAPLPPPPPYSTVLIFKSVQAQPVDGAFLFTIRFEMPDDALYSHSTFWWRLNPYSSWVEQRIDTKPAPGGEIPVTVGPLPRTGRYEYIVRSFDTDGRGSNFILRGDFFTEERQSGVPGVFVGAGGAVVQQISEGWTLPASQVPSTPRYDDDIDFIAIRPRLVNGEPQNPRRLSVTISQILYAFTAPTNDLIDGFRIYYKFRNDTFYSYEDFRWGPNYFPGQQVSFDLQGDFGARSFPTSAEFSETSFQSYDFIVRLLYKDGTVAQKQMGPVRAPVEQFIGLYNFVVAGTESQAAARLSSQRIPAGFTLQTVDQDPGQQFPSGNDIVPVVESIFPGFSTSTLRFVFFPPTNSRFRGYKIRFREVTPGGNPEFIELDVGTATDISTNRIIYDLLGNFYRHNIRYEWVITAQFSNRVTGQIEDCDESLYARASVPFSTSGNIMNTIFDFQIKDTNVALAKLVTPLPVAGTIVPIQWIKRQNVRGSTSDANFVASAGGNDSFYDVRRENNVATLNRWYRLKFQAPTDTWDNIIIYRRAYSQTGLNRTTVTSFAVYTDLGPWERVAVPRTALTKGSDGFYTVNVRGPLSQTYFDSSFEVTAGRTLVQPIYGPAPNRFPQSGSAFLNDIYPYYGAGNRLSSNRHSAEFIFVIQEGAEASTGIRLTEFYADSIGSAFRNEVDGLVVGNVAKDDVVTVDDFNGLNPAYQRNINQALSNITVFQLSGANVFGGGFPRRDSTTNTFPFPSGFLANPSGVTVY
jgi:hypothetical protein